MIISMYIYNIYAHDGHTAADVYLAHTKKYTEKQIQIILENMINDVPGVAKYIKEDRAEEMLRDMQDTPGESQYYLTFLMTDYQNAVTEYLKQEKGFQALDVEVLYLINVKKKEK